MFLESTCPGAR